MEICPNLHSLETGNNLTKTKPHIDYNNCNLSVSIESDRFFYGIFNESDDLLYVDEISGKPWQEFESLDLPVDQFKSTRFIFLNEVLHLPKLISDKQFPTHVLNPLTNSKYATEKLLDQDILTHYFVEPAIESIITDIFPKPEYCHISSLLADYFYKTNQPKLLLFVTARRIHILISDVNGLRFYNAYNYGSPEDFLYWILASIKTNHLDPSSTPVLIAGRIAKDGPILQLLPHYLKDYSFVDVLNWNIPDDVESFYYLDLYLSRICE